MTTARGAGRPPGFGGPQGGRGAPSSGPGAHEAHDPHEPHGPHGPNGPLSYSKAVVIAIVGVILGAYLLSLSSAPGKASPPTASSTTTTTAPGTTSSTSTTATTTPKKTTPANAAPSKSVMVLVANASHTTGIAGYYTTALGKDGWGTLTPQTALTVKTTSVVYFASGQEADAKTVASELHLPASAVQALGGIVPVQSTAGASVVVVAGLDLAAKVPATTTTTAAG